ncbi:hypothetical protein A3A09_01945 [Candidatus Nomurabacteria bacterium RIFCSPLOWO2_01_FULL_42_20]|uniref:DUF86 domain-containing protein n=1 Tax=Candidatus Nomurabacteria bacterium RIFCSPHIGHO2_01_FULL_42_16 TaxID=1801743 RepID=A0A1F6VH73_9BACT|nr:MAG: hypothetical protein A2824_02880 [Candidatus Nomurabacteria bacterium RIFCSPHIGHO2_01_FULL_42_16]OGI91382.1 MAG: hypothetical protein A3A09_01945 [Candidatus Nomurabacteria bacterium RIFCSPLOWO2_01_FULL_42_20]
MIERDVNLYIEDIFDAIDKINSYVLVHKDGGELKNDKKTYEAVMMNFIIIGEAIKNIYEQVREKYPKVEWKEIMDMRNMLVHEYWGIDEKVVWDTIKKDLPELKEILLRIKKGLN